ncbi:conjugative transfer signal peptidase TraF [Allopusillimonas ginsengisoli]|uniref:conjugative transfer signal peptidase TraF n=1 Tax=Allopusillimonas ginsengisoli TaxID=453575 RepID=UPI0039C4002D
MNRGRIFGVSAVFLAGAIGATFVAGAALGLRLNFTESAPTGLWRVSDTATGQRGELVEVCPPQQPVVQIMGDRGYLEPGGCPGDVIPLLKPIAAVAGDTVTLTQGQPAAVNGRVLPNTIAMPAVPAWPDGVYTVATGQVWLFSTYSAGSFDSRYFGPVPVANVRGRAVALLVAGEPADMTLTQRNEDDRY